MRIRDFRIMFLGAMAITLVVAACGGGADSTATSAPAPQATAVPQPTPVPPPTAIPAPSGEFRFVRFGETAAEVYRFDREKLRGLASRLGPEASELGTPS